MSWKKRRDFGEIWMSCWKEYPWRKGCCWGDFNAHMGEGNQGDVEVMGKYGFGQWNDEGQKVVDFAKSGDMAVVNIYHMKKAEHRLTYKSGRRNTQVDYILCRRRDLKEVGDCKVVVGESVAQQHRMVCASCQCGQ